MNTADNGEALSKKATSDKRKNDFFSNAMICDNIV